MPSFRFACARVNRAMKVPAAVMTIIRDPRALVLAYTAVLAAVAGWVNSVALLVWDFPVGNLTALTTKVGQHTTNPALHPAGMIVAVLAGFIVGALTCGVVLARPPSRFASRPAAVLIGEAVLLIGAAAIEDPFIRASLAAAACGLQNAMTLNFPQMPVRTTHFTGTITDLSLLAARSLRAGALEVWKAATLTATVALFIAGAAGGVILGGSLGDHALVPAAVTCAALAVGDLAIHRWRPKLAS